MQLLFSTDLALRTMMRLSAEPERHLSTETLARELSVSRNHLQKVVQSLTEAGLLRTIRGVKGGVMLPSPPRRSRSETSSGTRRGSKPWPNASGPRGTAAFFPVAA